VGVVLRERAAYPQLMDPVSTAIVSAIAAGSLAGLSDTVSGAVADAYAALKAAIKRRHGSEPVLEALNSLEGKPESPARRAVLEEEVVAAGLSRDEEVLYAAQRLLDSLGELRDSGQVRQQALGTGIAQASHGSSAAVSMSPRPASSGGSEEL
jgi:hypothetical protein